MSTDHLTTDAISPDVTSPDGGSPDRRVPAEERFDEWAIRHSRTPVLRTLMRLPVLVWRLGLGPLLGRIQVRSGHLVMLTVTGRSSGLPRHTPVTVHEVGDRTYLWCPYGDRAQWYRNATADPVVTVQSPRGTRSMQVTPLDDVDEVSEVVSELRRFDEPFLRGYLAAEGIADTPEDITGNWRRLHLRRLEPTRKHGPSPLAADLAPLWLVPPALAGMASVASRRPGRRTRRGGRRRR